MVQKFLSLHRFSIFTITLTLVSLIGFTMTNTLTAADYTRGIGIYPGNVTQDFTPVMKIDTKNYRNLAKLRSAFHSSSYDYNLTAQLVTDGIIDTKMPDAITVSTSQAENIVKYERERLLDNNSTSSVRIDSSSSGWVQIGVTFNNAPIDSINISGTVEITKDEPQGWSFMLNGSNDGKTWQQIGQIKGADVPGTEFRSFWRRPGPNTTRQFAFTIPAEKPAVYKFYRVSFDCPTAVSWSISDVYFYNNNNRVNVGGPYTFYSAWMSAGNNEEWIYVDLGAVCSIDKIMLYWIQSADKGVIQVSDDAAAWQDVKSFSAGANQKNEIRLDAPTKARYVRLLLTKPVADKNYILSEMEVYGTGGPVALPAKAAKMDANGKLGITGAWKLQRSSFISDRGETLSKIGYDDNSWIPATVPASVLMSYKNIGAVPDPNYSDNQVMISDSYFYSDFWYRTEFKAPSAFKNKHTFLNFDGINWKAEIFLNGSYVGRMEGAFICGKFDVSDKIIPGKKNSLAVRIIKNATPGSVKEQTKYSPDLNGGALGADNPTFHASIGWDWIPTIRGRNIGIWNDVFLSSSGPVTLECPYVFTDLALPDTTLADINIDVDLINHDNKAVSGILSGSFGDIAFEQPVTLAAMETKTVKLRPADHAALKIANPKLWWPTGYGRPDLYNVELKFLVDGKKISDSITFKSGVREMSFSEEGGTLRIWVNGRRFIGKGGNWGFPESNLSYRDREYDIAVGYHRDMNFTMIRNWVGQTGDDEFFEACDRNGVMIWQDFWLANPADGPDPDNNEMFLQNAKDFIERIRNHPSIGLYCGRNEGNPPELVDKGLRSLISELHPDMNYISNSAFGVVSGGGPYRAQTIVNYFEKRATPKFHSEMGMPNIVSYESLKEMIPDSGLWPHGRMWGIHDMCLNGAQGGTSFFEEMEKNFGPVKSAEEWVTLAQWVNYQGYRAMFEAQSKHRMGLLLWMSHSAWPSMVWQTYDYYFEPTAAYFGSKKGCEPLHIQWNAFTDSIEVVNYYSRNGKNLTVSMEIINMDGRVVWEKKVPISVDEDSVVRLLKVEYPADLTPVYFYKLKLYKSGAVISENFYWRSLENGNYKALRELPKVELAAATKIENQGSQWIMTTDLKNTTSTPVMMIRLKIIRENSGDRILPVHYSDNYFSLMPGDQKTISMSVKDEDTRGEKPIVIIEGFNLK